MAFRRVVRGYDVRSRAREACSSFRDCEASVNASAEASTLRPSAQLNNSVSLDSDSLPARREARSGACRHYVVNVNNDWPSFQLGQFIRHGVAHSIQPAACVVAQFAPFSITEQTPELTKFQVVARDDC